MATMTALERLLERQAQLPESVKQDLEIREASLETSDSKSKPVTGTLWYTRSVSDAQDQPVPSTLRGIMGPSYGLVSVYDTTLKTHVKVKELNEKDLQWYEDITELLVKAAKDGKTSLKLDISFELSLTQFGINHLLEGKGPAIELGKPKLR